MLRQAYGEIAKETNWKESRVMSEHKVDKGRTTRVRLAMSLPEAQALSEVLALRSVGVDGQRLLDQLWLRTVLIEQQRRIRCVERTDFRIRADRLLEALDPPRAVGPMRSNRKTAVSGVR
jgi:hypothetical protein